MSKITIQGINVEVTESLENHIEDHFSKLFSHYENLITGDIQVKIEVDKHHEHLNTASVYIPLSGQDVQMDETGEDMYHILADLQQRSARKLRKIKEKSQDKRRNSNKRELDEEE